MPDKPNLVRPVHGGFPESGVPSKGCAVLTPFGGDRPFACEIAR